MVHPAGGYISFNKHLILVNLDATFERKAKSGVNERKTDDLAFFAVVRNACTKP